MAEGTGAVGAGSRPAHAMSVSASAMRPWGVRRDGKRGIINGVEVSPAHYDGVGAPAICFFEGAFACRYARSPRNLPRPATTRDEPICLTSVCFQWRGACCTIGQLHSWNPEGV